MEQYGYEVEARTFYDAVAADYAETFRGVMEAQPMDMAMLAAFAAHVAAGGGGPVVEVGSGPGRVAAHLHGLGTDIRGVDLSPAMVALARRENPQVRYEVGSLTGLDVPDSGLAGIVAWYCLIHIPPERLPAALAEFARAVRPGGWALLAFQAGEGVRRHEQAFGHDVALDFHRIDPERIADRLADAGFDAVVRAVREPDGAHEAVRQGYVLARRRAAEPPAG
jgi:SAM-dependent methyltransferase